MNDYEILEKYVPKEKLKCAKQKLNAGYPVQYLVGNVEFFDTLIKVNENVLIPRFETEYLVDFLIKFLKDYHFDNPKILDIGTGSGCISIALKKHILCDITAIDISFKAIDVATENSKINDTPIKFLVQDIETFHPTEKFDVIVANPPYIPFGEKIDPKTKYEPQNALFAPDDGLYFYKVILSKSVNMLNKKSIIAFEIGYNQGEKLVSIAKEFYPTTSIILKNDLNGFNRYIYIINE